MMWQCWATVDASDNVHFIDSHAATHLGIDGNAGSVAVIHGTPAERRDFLARLILAAQAEVDRLDVAAAEGVGRAVAS